MSKEFADKKVLGLIEEVTIIGLDKKEEVIARIDTGATKSSMDINFAGKLKLGPILKSKLVKSAHGTKLRPVIEAEIILKGKKMLAEFSLVDRSHMKYCMLIGQNILKQGFIIDPSRE